MARLVSGGVEIRPVDSFEGGTLGGLISRTVSVISSVLEIYGMSMPNDLSTCAKVRHSWRAV